MNFLSATEYLQMVLRQLSGVSGVEGMTPQMIQAAARQEVGLIANGYLDAVRYRLGECPFFIEKCPENILYLGFIAKAFPAARLLHQRRHPRDACFAMYKQSYFRYAYTLENIGTYYVAYDRLLRHWRSLLGERLVEVDYESLVSDQQGQTRQLLAPLRRILEDAGIDVSRY